MPSYLFTVAAVVGGKRDRGEEAFHMPPSSLLIKLCERPGSAGSTSKFLKYQCNLETDRFCLHLPREVM